MTLDDMHTPGRDANDPELGRHDDPPTPAARTDNAPIADREVPLPRHLAPSLLHQWLDGDATVSVIRASTGGEDAVDLWTRINDEAELLRSRTTPLYVHKRIMDSLPADPYRVHQRWYRRPVSLNPLGILAAAAALVGLGALVARAAIH